MGQDGAGRSHDLRELADAMGVRPVACARDRWCRIWSSGWAASLWMRPCFGNSGNQKAVGTKRLVSGNASRKCPVTASSHRCYLPDTTGTVANEKHEGLRKGAWTADCGLDQLNYGCTVRQHPCQTISGLLVADPVFASQRFQCLAGRFDPPGRGVGKPLLDGRWGRGTSQ